MKPIFGPGPSYDPMDRIVQNLQNVDSFVSWLALEPNDLWYADSHLSSILSIRRTIHNQINALSEEPYNFAAHRLEILREDTETIFLYLEGAVGALFPLDVKTLRKMVKATEASLDRFDRNLYRS
jgi:hypothetical protein